MSPKRRRWSVLGLATLLAICVTARLAHSDVPETIRLQGVISQLQGQPVLDGNYSFRVEIFDEPLGGTPFYSGFVQAPIAAGAYSLTVTPSTPGELKAALTGEGGRFAQITVLTGPSGPINAILLPRQQVTSVPYALEAGSVPQSFNANAATVGPGSYNLIPNSHFSATDTSNTSVPSGGWAPLGTPGIAYGPVPPSEGAGLEVQISATGTPSEGIQFTLGKLKTSASYYMVARVDPDDGGGAMCRVVTTGGAANLNAMTDGAAVQTLTGTFDTEPVPAAVTLSLITENAGGRCDWASIGVFERNHPDSVVNPGIVVSTDSTSPAKTTFTNTVTVPNIDPELTIPAAGGILYATGRITLRQGYTGCDGRNCTAKLVIQYSINGVPPTQCRSAELLYHDKNDGEPTAWSTDIDCVVQNPWPGDTYVFSLAVTARDGTWSYGDVDGSGTDDTIYIDVFWYPSR